MTDWPSKQEEIWFQAGVIGEKQRIIKLLEAQCERPLDPTWEHYRETCSCAQLALIKGEK